MLRSQFNLCGEYQMTQETYTELDREISLNSYEEFGLTL